MGERGQGERGVGQGERGGERERGGDGGERAVVTQHSTQALSPSEFWASTEQAALGFTDSDRTPVTCLKLFMFVSVILCVCILYFLWVGLSM